MLFSHWRNYNDLVQHKSMKTLKMIACYYNKSFTLITPQLLESFSCLTAQQTDPGEMYSLYSSSPRVAALTHLFWETETLVFTALLENTIWVGFSFILI